MDARKQQRQAGRRSRGAGLALAVTAAAAAAAMLAACSAGPSGSPASSSQASSRQASNSQAPPDPGPIGTVSVGRPAWLLTRSALSQLIADPSARAELEDGRVYEILQPGQQPLAGVTAEPVVTFASAAALEDAVNRGKLPARTFGVLYDPETWSFTPVTEQRDPVRAATRAAAVAHAHGLRLIVTPALDLTTVLAPGARQPRWRQFLNLHLAGRLARVADVVELQAQSLERDTATYTAFARAAASQASTANRRIAILAGLSTNPPGAPVNRQQLMAAVQATHSIMNGYWLNIPGRGARCPACNAPRPHIAIQLLQALNDKKG